MVTMAQRIEELRTKKAMSRPALAAALGLPRLSIEKFETGRQTPTQEQQKLASAFGVSIAYLRGETDDPTSMDNWLSGAVPAEDPVVLPKAVRRATAAVVAQSGDSGKNDGGAVFSALLKSDSFKALVRETVLDVLKSPEGQALLAKAAKK